MTKELTVTQDVPITIEQVLIGGDLKNLSPAHRLAYYRKVCESLGLNYLTRPFEYVTFTTKQGVSKLQLYAKKDATDQLRAKHEVSVVIAARELVDDIYVVTARATLPSGRTDESIGAVYVGNVKDQEKANAFMRAETKSKRRVTLSIVGLGMLDETEVAELPDAVIGEPRVLTEEEIAKLQKAMEIAQTEPELSVLGERCQLAPEERMADLRKYYIAALTRIREDRKRAVAYAAATAAIEKDPALAAAIEKAETPREIKEIAEQYRQKSSEPKEP